jgi:hypothetical protein
MQRPEDVIPHLAKGVQHWKGGYSAHSLATVWFAASGFPPKVRTLLDTHSVFRDVTMLDGFFEHQTELDDNGRPSQTDLLVLAKTSKGLLIIGVEGKAEESFGKRLSEWLGNGNAKAGRKKRLELLQKRLGLKSVDLSLRYQLFHCSAACAIEAERYGARHALLLIHSFSEKQTSLEDYKAFVAALGLDASTIPSAIAGPMKCQIGAIEISLYFGWITDRHDAADFWSQLGSYTEQSTAYAQGLSDWIAKRGP